MMDDIRLLSDLMSEISEQSFCAGWMDGIEKACQKIYNGEDLDSVWKFTQEQKAELIRLRNKVGYWVTYSENGYIRWLDND